MAMGQPRASDCLQMSRFFNYTFLSYSFIIYDAMINCDNLIFSIKNNFKILQKHLTRINYGKFCEL